MKHSKLNKKFDNNYIFIIIFCCVLISLILSPNTIFGSKIDWLSQHTVFPDYFRKLFYDTKNIFPNFAMQLGAGQNIYNFSYYGLYNPLLMISVLFPMISMRNYIIILNILLFNFLGIVLYYFLKNKTDKKTALMTTLILLMSSSILFHFHRHFMFVNYLPFLVLALIGVDKFFNNKRKSLLAFSIFLIITSSYYYSIPSIIVIYIYALYKYLELNEKINIKKIFKTAFCFTIPVIIAITSSAILLLPTFLALKEGREINTETVGIIQKLIPIFNLNAILYDNYSLGLTFISLISLLIGIISVDKKTKFLSIIIIILFSFPLFIYMLNGNLYLRNKVLIPFIPLFGILLIKFLPSLLDKKISLKNIMISSIIIIIISLISKFENKAIYLDISILLLIIVLYYKNIISKKTIYSVILLVPLITVLISNNFDKYVSKEEINNFDNKKNQTEINNILKKEKDLVRTNNLDSDLIGINHIYNTNYNTTSVYSSVYNPLYKNFYAKVFNNAISYRNNLILSQNNDILFQSFMGVKYIYTTKDAPIGYKKISKNIYENKNVLPIFYGTSDLINESDFDKLKYPYNLEKLLKSTVVQKQKSTISNNSSIKKVNLKYNINKQKNIKIEQTDKYLKVKALKDNNYINIKLDESINNDILLVKIELLKRSSCEEGDLGININGINNVLTCEEWIYKNDNKNFHYVISSNKSINNLKIKLKKGTYHIKDIEVYNINYKDISNMVSNKDKFVIDKINSTNENIKGSITMKNDGYFVTSIPYDKNFTVKVDNNVIHTEIVNKAFLGFKLEQGTHQINITYNNPYQKISIIFTIIGLLSFIVLLLTDKYSMNIDNDLKNRCN